MGASYEVAAMAAGIDQSTLFRWRVNGEKAKRGKFYEFCKALKRAEAEGEVKHISTVIGEGPTGSKWILERRFPERWARKEKTEVEHSGKIDIEVVTAIPRPDGKEND